MGFVFYLIAMCVLLTSPTAAGDIGVKLTPPPGAFGKGDHHPQFGRALGLSGRVLAVGAPYAFEGKGAVLLYCGDFTKPGLVKIVRHKGDALFGFALALAGNKLAVASKTRVYLYTWTGDCPRQLSFRAALNNFRFIFDLAIDGRSLAIGDSYAGRGDERGGAYVYTFSNDRFLNPRLVFTVGDRLRSRNHLQIDLEEHSAFGHFVDLRGDRLIIGADKHNGTAGHLETYFGAAFVVLCQPHFKECRRTGTIGMGQQHPIDLKPGDFFGASGKSAGNRLYVGAPGDDGLGGTTEGYGAVHIIDLKTMRQVGKLGHGYAGTPEVGLEEWDRFGYAVAIDNGRIAIGVPQSDSRRASEPSGYVYLFEGPTDEWGSLTTEVANQREENAQLIAEITMQNAENARLRKDLNELKVSNEPLPPARQ